MLGVTYKKEKKKRNNSNSVFLLLNLIDNSHTAVPTVSKSKLHKIMCSVLSNLSELLVRNDVKLDIRLFVCMVDSGYGLGRSLRARRPALPKGQKYQRVKSSICVSVGLPIVCIRPMADMGFLFCGVFWGTISHASIKLVLA